MQDWQVNKEGTCAQPVRYRAMPENEKPPAMRVDHYYYFVNLENNFIKNLYFVLINAIMSLLVERVNQARGL